MDFGNFSLLSDHTTKSMKLITRLIPDFIPVIGYLDDLIILPLGIYLVIKLIPEAVWSDCMAKAELNPIQLPKNRYAAAVIIGFWLLFAGLCSYAVWHLVSN